MFFLVYFCFAFVVFANTRLGKEDEKTEDVSLVQRLIKWIEAICFERASEQNKIEIVVQSNNFREEKDYNFCGGRSFTVKIMRIMRKLS